RLGGADGHAVAEAEADGADAASLDRADERLVDASRENADDLPDLVVGRDADAVSSLGLEAQAVDMGIDRAAAAVHDDEAAVQGAIGLGDRIPERPSALGVVDAGAADLDDER